MRGSLSFILIIPANVASFDHRCPCPATHQYPLPLLEFSDSPGIKTEEIYMEIFVEPTDNWGRWPILTFRRLMSTIVDVPQR